MRIGSVTAWALAMTLGAMASGCGDESAAGSGGGGDGSDDSTSAETTGTGATTGSAGLEVPGGAGQTPKAAYPAGPYGIGVGSVLTDFTFVGYTRPAVDRADLETVALSDFYNPTGTEVFPEDGRAWAGQPKPKAIALSVAAAWCPPCKEEWRDIVPVKQAALGPKGGEFMLLMSDGNDGGVPPVLSELNAWVGSFKITAPAVLDPTLDFQPVWESDAFPQNILVRTSDMRIIAKAGGVPTESYWTKMEQILDGQL